MLALRGHGGTDRLGPAVEDPRLILPAARQQQDVESIDLDRGGHRHEMVAAEIANLPLNAAFLMPFVRCAELRGEPPVRAERYEAHRFLSPVAPQNLAYRAFQIVVPQHPEYAAKVLKRQFVRLQKRLLGGVQIGPMKCR